MAPGTKLTLGVKIDADGATLPSRFAEAAREAGLQLRVELVADGYDKRHLDFGKIHGVQEDDLQLLVQALGLHEGARVLDLGCGCGEVSANILAEADRRQINIDLYPCDLHQAQIQRISQDTQSRARKIVVGDARSFRLDQLLHMPIEAGFNEAQPLRQVHFRQFDSGATRQRTRWQR